MAPPSPHGWWKHRCECLVWKKLVRLFNPFENDLGLLEKPLEDYDSKVMVDIFSAYA